MNLVRVMLSFLYSALLLSTLSGYKNTVSSTGTEGAFFFKPREYLFGAGDLAVGDRFNITMATANLTDMWGVQTKVHFNSTVLNCTGAYLAPDNPFKDHGHNSPSPWIDNVQGIVAWSCGFDGPTSVNVTEADTFLFEFEVMLEPSSGCVNSTFEFMQIGLSGGTYWIDSQGQRKSPDCTNGYYELSAAYKVTVDPDGGRVYVDSEPVTALTVYSWENGSTHVLDPDSGYSSFDGKKLLFTLWDDGNTSDPKIITATGTTTYRVEWQTQYRLIVKVIPQGGGTTNLTMGTYWYDSGQCLTVAETENSGFTFGYWDLDGYNVGNGESYTATMNAPHTLTAFFNTPPKYGGTLRIGMLPKNRLRTLNPFLDIWYDLNHIPVFSTLLRYDNALSLLPDLAEQFEISEDGMNLTFRLFENVTWHDGVEFNASDVKFTFETILTNPQVEPFWRTYIGSLVSIDLINASAFVFHLHEPDCAFVHNLPMIPIIPKHAYEGTDIATNPANDNPIGTGAFAFSQWTAEKNLTIHANEHYFRGRPYLDSIIYRWDIGVLQFPSTLENNEIDVIPFQVDPNRIDELKRTTGTTIASVESCGYRFLGFNLSNPVLSDPNVRKAIAYAINRTDYVEKVYCGYATVADSPIPQSMQGWYDPYAVKYECDPALAEQLLDIRYPRNPEWRFNLTIKSARVPQWYLNSSDLLKRDLEAVGINVTIEYGSAWQDIVDGKGFDAACLGAGFDSGAPDDLYVFYYTGAPANYWNYSNPNLDTILRAAKESYNETERKALFDQAQEIILEDFPSPFLCHELVVEAYNNDFHGAIQEPCLQGYLLLPRTLENTWYEPALSGEGNCPMFVSFVDSAGRRSGYDATTGGTVLEIPESSYSGLDSDPQLVKIRSPLGNYTVELYGTGNGSYSLEIVNIALGYKNVNVPTANIHLNQTRKYYVRVYPDGSIFVFDAQADVYEDGIVELMDFYYTSVAYLSSPGHPNWNPRADVNSDDIVELMDFFALSQHYLEQW
jgi:peptide/nickel transport system substrate-binding protein